MAGIHLEVDFSLRMDLELEISQVMSLNFELQNERINLSFTGPEKMVCKM